MSSTDGPGADPKGAGQASDAEQVQTQLVEALMLLLIEKGVLTRNDALSIIQTVAQVQRGTDGEGIEPTARSRAALGMLQRMYLSFEALADGSRALLAGGKNVHHLRPPIYGGRPEFPRDD